MELEHPITRFAYRKSDTIGKIGAALAKAQKAMRHAVADSENPHFKSHYADLASVIDAVKDPLADNEIARPQFPISVGGEVGVVTSLIHSSGEWLEAEVYCRPVQATPQGIGSAITYLRRYSLAAAAGLAQTDDDAEAAERPAKAARKAAEPKTVAVLTLTDDGWAETSHAPALQPSQQVAIQMIRKELQISDNDWRAKLHAYFGKASSADLSREEASRWIDLLERTRRARTSPPSEAPPTTSPPKS